MRAVILDAPNASLRYTEDHPDPVAGNGLILDVTACGVCHSDIHVADGDFGKPPPIILGHEVTGVHEDLGPVMLYAPWGCMSCRECADGQEMICANATEAGLFADGGYAAKMAVPDLRYLAPLEGLDPYDAAPLACGGLTAWRGVQQGLGRLHEVGAGGRALVIGAGGLGQFAIRYLRLLSDAHVSVLDLSETKQANALEIGAHAAASSLEDGRKYDVVIDFVGAEGTLRAAAESVARRGVVAVVGLAGGSIPFGFGIVPPETHFVASVWGSRAQMDELLALARREPTLVPPVDIFDLAEAERAHQQLRAGEVRGRVVLDVSGGRTPANESNNHTTVI